MLIESNQALTLEFVGAKIESVLSFLYKIDRAKTIVREAF